MGRRALTQDEYIERVSKIHDAKYDYSLVKYKNSRTKIAIVCPIHGLFYQRADLHMHGAGCPACGGRKKLIQAEYIARAKAKWGDLCDYSLVEYVNMRSDVRIKCNICGTVYSQCADSHLEFRGCPVCANEGRSQKCRMSFDEFLFRAHNVHGDIYDYSVTKWVDFLTDIVVGCPIHGNVKISPRFHLEGCGCPKCANKLRNLKAVAHRSDIVHDGVEFIEKSKLIHGNKYDYSDVNYVDSKTPVEIKCNVCGHIFLQKPCTHLAGHGCSYCARALRAAKLVGSERLQQYWNSVRLSYLDFVTRCRGVHGDKYDYSLVEYKNMDTKVRIKCNVCGNVFCQRPNDHLHGQGCPECGKVTGKMKSIATKRKNGTFGKSKLEDRLYVLLCNVFGVSDVFRHYDLDDRYPFCVDFYIGSRDMFIELNAFWSHGGHWFNDNSISDGARLTLWLQKAESSKSYADSIYTWLYRDVEKREMARENNLNYVVFWNNDLKDFKEWVAAGCPDAQDWRVEYSWNDSL